MLLAIIALNNPEDSGAEPERKEALATAKIMQALAVGLAARSSDRLQPLIICSPNSRMAKAASDAELPFMLYSSNPWSLFKLWQWRRQQSAITILTQSGDSLKLANRLAGMTKKYPASIQLLALLEAPELRKPADLVRTGSCICGSSFIAQNIGERLSIAKNPHIPDLVELAPGISLADYEFPATPWEKGKRFVFGMGDSLMPDSGALLTVRAMSALWQHEDIPPWEVRMFGNGPRFNEILEEAEKLGVLPRLSLLSDQPLPEVTRFCHVWLAPGISSSELPWTLWAGFAAGLPIIASQSELHKQRILEPGSVLPISANNPQEMARSMLELMRNPALRQSLSAYGGTMRPYISLKGMGQRVCDFLAKDLPDEQPKEEQKIN